MSAMGWTPPTRNGIDVHFHMAGSEVGEGPVPARSTSPAACRRAIIADIHPIEQASPEAVMGPRVVAVGAVARSVMHFANPAAMALPHSAGDRGHPCEHHSRSFRVRRRARYTSLRMAYRWLSQKTGREKIECGAKAATNACLP